MRKNIRKALRIIFKILAAVFFVLGIGIGMLFFDTGRNVIINAVGQYLKSKSVDFVVEGLNGNATRIRKILVKTSGVELIFSDINFAQKQFLDRFSIYVDKFILNKTATSSDIPNNLENFALVLEILRFLVADLSLGKGIINIAGATHELEDLHYVSEQEFDRFAGKIDQKHELEIILFWNESVCENGAIKFKKFYGFDGILELCDLAKDITNYKLDVANSCVKIKSVGNYRNFLRDIKIDNALVEYQNNSANISGNLYLTSKQADLNTSVNLSELIKDLPPKIKQNFEDITAVINAKCDFNDEFVGQANVFFQESANTIGQLTCNFQNEILNVSGNIDWIVVFGFKPKQLQCKIDKFSEIFLHINGDDFELMGNAKIAEKILVKNLKLVTKDGGYIASSGDFIVSPESVSSFDFKFNRLEFLKKTMPISGDCAGSFSHRNGQLLSAKCSGKNLIFDGHNFTDFSVTMAEENISICSKNADLYKIKISNLHLDLKGEQLTLSGIANNNFSFYADGKYHKSVPRISLSKCFIKSPKILCNFDIGNLDFSQNIYKISCHLSNARGIAMGNADISCNGHNIDVNIDSFQTKWIHELVQNIPVCKLSGSLKLIRNGGHITGDGNASIILSPKNIIDLKLNAVANGLSIKTVMNYKNENVRIDVFLPIVFRSNGTLQKDLHAPHLKCNLSANANLENFLELRDKIDVRGTLNCDIHMTGSMTNPIIHGVATLKKTRFIIGGVTLRNGTISMTGNGDNSLVLIGNFLDSKKQKATANGKIFLEDSCSTMKTNLDLHLAKYKLFDSDDKQISIIGDGKITGNLDDLLISGSVDVPECKIQRFDTDNSANDDDIIIENKINVINKATAENTRKKDFLSYDIKMRCPKIIFTGKVFEMVLAGNLQLLTHDHKTTMSGLLKLINGRLDLFGKRMKIIEGSAEFFKEFPFDPKAKFKCNNTFGDLAVYLEINNQPGEGVAFNLYSFPSYSKDTILSNILFGKDLKYLSLSEAAQLAHAVASFNNRGYIFSLLNTFQNIGIIDTLSFSSSEKKAHSLNTDKSSRAENDMNLSAGKYLHDNIYISINKTSEETFFDVDWSITPKISVKANTNGEVGVSWKYRY